MYREPGRGKLESRSREGRFIGYSEESKGYRILFPDIRKVEIYRDVNFQKQIKARKNLNFTKLNQKRDKEKFVSPRPEPIEKIESNRKHLHL